MVYRGINHYTDKMSGFFLFNGQIGGEIPPGGIDTVLIFLNLLQIDIIHDQ